MPFLLIVASVGIRLLLVPLSGFKADMAFWKGWGLAAADRGVVWLVGNTNYNYPPGFTYVLFLINKIYAIFASPYNVSQYWSESNTLYLFLFKLLIIISDIVVAALIIKIALIILKNNKNKLKIAIIAAILYLFNPVVLFDGVVWGQVDQFGMMFFIACLYFLLSDKPNYATISFTLACLMKFQNIIFIPLFFLFIFKKYSFKTLVNSLQLAALTFLITAVPFILKKETGSLIKLLTMNSDYFPFYSLNAFNIWWILSGLKGMAMTDKNLMFGIVSAKQLGLYFFILAYFIACVNVFFASREDLIKKFVLSCSFAVFAFFHLLTQSHERYLFHLVGLLLIYFLLERKKLIKSDLFFYTTFCGFFFLDLYMAMFFNYPDQVIWPFSTAQTTDLTLPIAVFQIIIFIFFFIRFIFPAVKKQIKIIGVFTLLLAAAIFFQNRNYFLGKEISLTEIKPIEVRQDFLYPMMNKNLNSHGNVFAFARLSSNYYFYNRGIASHADASITYDLGGRFSQFKSDFGLDTEADQRAAAYFIIEGDGRELFRSTKKGRFDNPSTVKVNIHGVDKLTLKIKKEGNSNYGAHTDWLDPVLIK